MIKMANLCVMQPTNTNEKFQCGCYFHRDMLAFVSKNISCHLPVLHEIALSCDVIHYWGKVLEVEVSIKISAICFKIWYLFKILQFIFPMIR